MSAALVSRIKELQSQGWRFFKPHARDRWGYSSCCNNYPTSLIGYRGIGETMIDALRACVANVGVGEYPWGQYQVSADTKWHTSTPIKDAEELVAYAEEGAT